MYGILLENFADVIRKEYGDQTWDRIRRLAEVDMPSFSTHQVYPENLISKLLEIAVQELHISKNDFMFAMGKSFVAYVSQYGYDRVLTVLGRYLRDFLNGLDNLHEYLKFSYPKMNAPSFFCENETKNGLTLHYRSRRNGFVHYTMGLITQVAKAFYDTDIVITIIKQDKVNDTNHVIFDINFDNKGFYDEVMNQQNIDLNVPVSAATFFEIFPFSITFGSDMIIRTMGKSLTTVLSNITGKKITESFTIVRPLVELKYISILKRMNNIFELVTKHALVNRNSQMRTLYDESSQKLHLKGQMMYVSEWKMIMYLATPVMADLTAMINTGFYINDLSMHDFSRDLMLAGTQQSVELKLALDQEQLKSKRLEESMRKLDEEMKRTDELLYQMIPKQVADRLRAGENPVDTCQEFFSVTILFSDIVSFTQIASRITPLEVVSMLNSMYSIFDRLTETHGVYKVETIGDAYMIVSGAPEEKADHAQPIADMAMDMVEGILDLVDPSTGDHLRIRIGMHSGPVVAGIVGLKMPRMESNSEPMKILITQSTADLLPVAYQLKERGEIEIKGKGKMKTYWLLDKKGRKHLNTQELYKEKLDSSENPRPVSRRSIYSPVTVEEVEKRRSSIASAYRMNAADTKSRASSPKQRLSVPTDSKSRSELNLKFRRQSTDTTDSRRDDPRLNLSTPSPLMVQSRSMFEFKDKETQTVLRGTFKKSMANGSFVSDHFSLKNSSLRTDICCAAVSPGKIRSHACTLL